MEANLEAPNEDILSNPYEEEGPILVAPEAMTFSPSKP